jgi:ABC-type uncharacterized transport system auxiliary subunit
MHNFMKKIFWITLLILTMAGCRSSKPVVPRFYVIEFPVQKETFLPDTLTHRFGSVEILPVNVYPAFATHRIAIREGSHELRYFSNHEWAVRPGEALTLFITEFYKKNIIFDQVSTRFWNIDPEYRFETTVYQLEVVQDRGRYYARIHLNYILRETSTSRILTEHTADLRLELPKRNLNLFADEISLIFYDELKVFTEKILPALTINIK